jgi:hypothetical protein
MPRGDKSLRCDSDGHQRQCCGNAATHIDLVDQGPVRPMSTNPLASVSTITLSIAETIDGVSGGHQHSQRLRSVVPSSRLSTIAPHPPSAHRVRTTLHNRKPHCLARPSHMDLLRSSRPSGGSSTWPDGPRRCGLASGQSSTATLTRPSSVLAAHSAVRE